MTDPMFPTRISRLGPCKDGLRAIGGFTLIELMVVLTVMAILAGIAAPSFTSAIASQRVGAVASDLHLTLMKARAEALKRNVPVTMSAAGGDWATGWSILDPETPAGPPLHVRSSSAGVSVTGSVAEIVYSSTGRSTLGAEASFRLASTKTDLSKCIYIDPTGRPYVKSLRGSASC